MREGGPGPAETKQTFDQSLAALPPDVRALLPDKNLSYYRATSEMHSDLTKPGGSKFLETSNILKVLEKDAGRIPDAVSKREDDRQRFLDEGVDPKAFLPATKKAGDPEGLPEALYYRVDGVRGKLGVVQLQELDPATNVIVRREKSVKDESGREKVPSSFSIVRETLDDMPDTDYATVIVGREGGENGSNELWTIHPGPPVRPAQGDIVPGADKLSGPEEGVKQKVILTTVRELLDTGKVTGQDYVKIEQGNERDVLSKYDVKLR